MLYEYLLKRAKTARFHMPGHKGVPILGAAPELFDLTELADTGDLYEDTDDVIKASERQAAADYGADGCVFLAGGSTPGIQAVLGAVCAGAGTRRRVLVLRGAHLALYNACILLDCGFEHADSAEDIESLLESGGYSAVFATSPDYYGTLLDTAAIHETCRRNGVPLILDAAHGAHLAWLGIKQHADYIIMSAHKTLAAFGGAAMVCIYGAGGAQQNSVRRFAGMFGSSSPSYLILASLDRALCELRSDGGTLYKRTAGEVAKIVAALPGSAIRSIGGAHGDPTRLYLAHDGMDGFAFAAALRECGVEAEMADRRGVVLICTPPDLCGNLSVLRETLHTLGGMERSSRHTAPGCTPPLVPPPLERVLPMREAALGNTRRVPIADSEGEISAQIVAVYPPGLPAILPGEKISQKILAFLRENMYNMNKSVAVAADK